MRRRISSRSAAFFVPDMKLTMPDFSALANLTDRVACPRNPHHSSFLEHSSPFSRSSPYPSLYHRCSPACSFYTQTGSSERSLPDISKTQERSNLHHLDRPRFLFNPNLPSEYSDRSELGQLASCCSAPSSRRSSSPPSSFHRPCSHHSRPLRSPPSS